MLTIVCRTIVSKYLRWVGMNKQILKQFGMRVREERARKGFSQERLGELAKVHRTYIGMIERAEKNITLTNMEKIARALGKKVSDLVDF